MEPSTNSSPPVWWHDRYDSLWERVKAALRRDIEQTRHDLGSRAHRDLGQRARDTVLQALGWAPRRWSLVEATGLHRSLGAWTAHLARDLRPAGEREARDGPRARAMCLV